MDNKVEKCIQGLNISFQVQVCIKCIFLSKINSMSTYLILIPPDWKTRSQLLPSPLRSIAEPPAKARCLLQSVMFYWAALLCCPRSWWLCPWCRPTGSSKSLKSEVLPRLSAPNHRTRWEPLLPQWVPLNSPYLHGLPNLLLLWHTLGMPSSNLFIITMVWFFFFFPQSLWLQTLVSLSLTPK